MTISVKHTKTSGVSDSANSQIVQPSDWNAEHTYSMATGKLVGRTTASTGTFEEITANTNHFTLASKVLGFATALNMTGITQSGGSYSGVVALGLTSASGTARYLELYTGASTLRWQVGKSGTPESGSNVGSDYAINRYDDAGGYLDTPFLIARQNGEITMNATALAASTTALASINIAHGVAPTSPVNGDVWTTSAGGLFVRVNGATYTMDTVEGAQTFTAKKTFFTATTAAASFTVPHGAAPTSPVNGDVWTTSAGGLFVRVNGVTFTMDTLESAQTVSGRKTFSGQSTSGAPVTLSSGTLATTAAAGGVEFDGTAFYANAVASSRQVVAAHQIVTVQGTKTALTNSIATAQAIFSAATDTLTVPATTSYRFRSRIAINTGATTHTTAFGFGGTATITTCNYTASAISSAAATLATPQVRRVSAATATVLTATSTAVQTDIWLEGIIRINGAGTIIPQITFSAGPTGTCEIDFDSFFELTPIGTNTVVAVGNFG